MTALLVVGVVAPSWMWGGENESGMPVFGVYTEVWQQILTLLAPCSRLVVVVVAPCTFRLAFLVIQLPSWSSDERECLWESEGGFHFPVICRLCRCWRRRHQPTGGNSRIDDSKNVKGNVSAVIKQPWPTLHAFTLIAHPPSGRPPPLVLLLLFRFVYPTCGKWIIVSRDFSSACKSIQESSYRSHLKMVFEQQSPIVSPPYSLSLSTLCSSSLSTLFFSIPPSVCCVSYLHNASSREPKGWETRLGWLIGGAGWTRRLASSCSNIDGFPCCCCCCCCSFSIPFFFFFTAAGFHNHHHHSDRPVFLSVIYLFQTYCCLCLEKKGGFFY